MDTGKVQIEYISAENYHYNIKSILASDRSRSLLGLEIPQLCIAFILLKKDYLGTQNEHGV